MTQPSRKGQADWRSMLMARPLHNAKARVERDARGGLFVYVHAVRPRYLVPPISWVVPFRNERRVCLDRLGIRVWELCDGKRTVEDVIDAFVGNYGLTFHEARVAVTSYIRTLVQRGVLAVELRE